MHSEYTRIKMRMDVVLEIPDSLSMVSKFKMNVNFLNSLLKKILQPNLKRFFNSVIPDGVKENALLTRLTCNSAVLC